MLRFKQFVDLSDNVSSVRARAARTNEYRKFVQDALAKFKVSDVHDLDDLSYEQFVEQLKSFRKSRGINEDVDLFPGEC